MSKKKILIVEDDTFLLDAYQLKMKGQTDWKVSIAEDGKEALKQAKDGKPDIIILDVLLPSMSGIDVLKQLKADDSTKDIPVVMASNVDQKKVVDEAMENGAVDYFVKSDITIADLIKKCQEHL